MRKMFKLITATALFTSSIVSYGTELEIYCHKIHPKTVTDCVDFIEECVWDGEKQLWCVANYSEMLKEARAENE